MSEVELALIERWLKRNKVKAVGDVRPIEKCHYFSGAGPTVKEK